MDKPIDGTAIGDPNEPSRHFTPGEHAIAFLARLLDSPDVTWFHGAIELWGIDGEDLRLEAERIVEAARAMRALPDRQPVPNLLR